jgi:hypothetical protein
LHVKHNLSKLYGDLAKFVVNEVALAQGFPQSPPFHHCCKSLFNNLRLFPPAIQLFTATALTAKTKQS